MDNEKMEGEKCDFYLDINPLWMAPIPIENNDERQQPPYNYPCPPRYTSVSDDIFGKPPSYEQTVQQLSETHNNNENSMENPPVTFPVTTTITSSNRSTESTRNQY
ncbi:unnamed protein product [Rotaria sp. Silwood2]|nr:unnamed protein product [Rotaria sp. Silwood2]CAF2969730.1 unnamed protein product [Rotaria sp. Silwood2]CAF3942730.1 unnamed protein product [Rotaria sp. Silwood2]CAF4046049.1 unnamed protein product [Rotaria sp. Silwood2]